MRTATLAALISSVLEVLFQGLILGIYVFRPEIDDPRILHVLGIGSRCLFTLFSASLALFFLVYYRKRVARTHVRPESGS